MTICTLEKLAMLPDKGKSCYAHLAQNDTLRSLPETGEEVIYRWLREIMEAIKLDEAVHQQNTSLGHITAAHHVKERYNAEIALKTGDNVSSHVTRVFAVEDLVRMLARLTQFTGGHFRHSEVLTMAWIEKTVDTHAGVRLSIAYQVCFFNI